MGVTFVLNSYPIKGLMMMVKRSFVIVACSLVSFVGVPFFCLKQKIYKLITITIYYEM
jgi:hypothetical protein